MTTANETEIQMIHGVNITQTQETIEHVTQDPELGAFRFRARNKWKHGSQNTAEIADFYGVKTENQHKSAYPIEMDEPTMLLGKDEAANPAEILLAALSGCMTTTLAYYSAKAGLEIECIESEYDGDVDLQGFLGTDSMKSMSVSK